MERVLVSVREINAAVWDNVNGRCGAIYCALPDGTTYRINRARSMSGVLQVHSLERGRWVVPVRVWHT